MRVNPLSRIATCTITLLAIGVCVAFTGTAMATDEWDVIGGTGDWNVGSNWSHGTVPVGTTFIASFGTVNLSTTQTIGQLLLGSDWSNDDNANGGPHAGPGTLNVLSGANLSINGFTMGFEDDNVGSDPTGTANQSGGTVTVASWMDVASKGEAFYNISGGTLDVNTNLTLGRANTGSNGSLAVTGASASIDVQDQFHVTEVGHLKFVFDDASGVSTIAVGGNARIDVASMLDVELATGAAFNTNDVFTLIDSASGITGNNNAGAGPHEFLGLPDNDIIQIGGLDTFRINYDPVTDFTVTLTALRNVAAIPEPNTLALLAMGTLTMIGRKPKRK